MHLSGQSSATQLAGGRVIVMRIKSWPKIIVNPHSLGHATVMPYIVQKNKDQDKGGITSLSITFPTLRRRLNNKVHSGLYVQPSNVYKVSRPEDDELEFHPA